MKSESVQPMWLRSRGDDGRPVPATPSATPSPTPPIGDEASPSPGDNGTQLDEPVTPQGDEGNGGDNSKLPADGEGGVTRPQENEEGRAPGEGEREDLPGDSESEGEKELPGEMEPGEEKPGEEDSAKEKEPEVSTIELLLDENGHIPSEVLQPYLQPGTLLKGPDEKLSLGELSSHMPVSAVCIAGAVLTVAVVEACVLCSFSRKNKKLQRALAEKTSVEIKPSQPAQPLPASSVLAASMSNIGRRQSQQDSRGMARVDNGWFAVVADGMGGLSDGDKVSQQIVRTMIADAEHNSLSQLNGNLDRMVAHANDDVNKLLGPRDRYVSGSTLVAVLAERSQFQWISVGDSRIYLYRDGVLLQLNREHIYEAELLNFAVNGDMSFQEAHDHEKRKSVSSFIGMGKLKYVDQPMRPIPSLPGDRVLLTSDGVFNTLSDSEIADILRLNPDPAVAARELEAAVLKKAAEYQDNFTSIILAWQ